MAERAWLSRVQSEFTNSPLASNVFFGFVLTALEKLVEVEFACPCEAKLNAWFAAAFFVVPALLVILLMISIQGYKKEKQQERGKYFLYSIAPAIVWLILTFFDGRYYVCARTDWSGRFVFVPNDAPKKWCKPTNSSSSSEDELQKSLRWYSLSQVIGMVFVVSLIIVLGSYVIKMFKDTCRRKGHQEPEASVQVNLNPTPST